MTGPIGPGAFVAVVGASGVGKDTLIEAARRHCGAAVVFPRRTITRPAGAGEDHEPVSPDEFARLRDEGGLAITWHAHGLDYGLPVSIDTAIAGGRVVVANVSRGVLDGLRARYEHVVAVRVTVSEDVREARIRGRGRESGTAVAGRVRRPDPSAGRPLDHEIVNDGTVAEGANALLAVIDAAARRILEDA